MSDIASLAVDASIIGAMVVGISWFRRPGPARRGNLLEAAALCLAVLVVLYRHRVTELPVVFAAVAAGSVFGWLAAVRVNMTQIPAMVAFQHGMGGLAALFVSFVELSRRAHGPSAALSITASLLGLAIGAATFSGSMVAAAKLANRIRQTPTILRRHNAVLCGLVFAVVVLAALAQTGDGTSRAALGGLALAAVGLGAVFAVRIGGADMPVLISFLNATAGLAAAFCGLAIQNRLLIAAGATVVASGSILTHIMCKGMNRSLAAIFTGLPAVSGRKDDGPAPAPAPHEAPPPAPVPRATPAPEDPLTRADRTLREAATIIIVPGYGMALAEAQFETVELAEKLESMGKKVRFAIHPVAGRMPGHMHVLLAEAEVDYRKLAEIDAINAQFKDTDVALIVGACDVVNPAAIRTTGTPISGMPILLAHEARAAVVCNLDEKPGYSGVENPLYRDPRTILLLGDAKERLRQLIDRLF